MIHITWEMLIRTSLRKVFFFVASEVAKGRFQYDIDTTVGGAPVFDSSFGANNSNFTMVYGWYIYIIYIYIYYIYISARRAGSYLDNFWEGSITDSFFASFGPATRVRLNCMPALADFSPRSKEVPNGKPGSGASRTVQHLFACACM